MATIDEPRPLSAIIGERLKEFREERSLRQSDVASAAASLGLRWGRSSVAALEAGTRNLSFEEVLLVPTVIGVLGGWGKPLLRNDDVKLSESSHVSSAALMRFTEGLVRPMGPIGASPDGGAGKIGSVKITRTPPGVMADIEVARPAAKEGAWMMVAERLYPQISPAKIWATGTVDSELMSRVAARVKFPNQERVTWVTLPVFSLGLWGRSFQAERDARVPSEAYPSQRSKQSARGHATREMVGELSQEMEANWAAVEDIFEQLDAVWDSQEGLQEFRKQAFHWANEAVRIAGWEERIKRAEEFFADNPDNFALLTSVGSRVRDARDEMKLSRGEVSQLSGVSTIRIENIENVGWYLKITDRDKAHKTLRALAESLRLNGDDLVSVYDAAMLGIHQ